MKKLIIGIGLFLCSLSGYSQFIGATNLTTSMQTEPMSNYTSLAFGWYDVNSLTVQFQPLDFNPLMATGTPPNYTYTSIAPWMFNFGVGPSQLVNIDTTGLCSKLIHWRTKSISINQDTVLSPIQSYFVGCPIDTTIVVHLGIVNIHKKTRTH